MSLPKLIEEPNQQTEYMFYIHSTDKKRKRDTSAKKKEQEKKEKYILCGHCENKITRPKYKLEIEGAFDHTFLNPAGHVFHIGCFDQAEGCAVFGDSTYEWSWFSGFSWRVAHCNQCLKHLGWFFSANSEQSFFGLVLDSLI